VFYQRSARSAASPPGRASRGRSALLRVTTRAVLPVAAVGGLAAFSIAAPAATVAAPAATHVASVRPVPDIGRPVFHTGQLPAPITTAQCLADFGIHCYTPVQYRAAYDLNSLYSGAATGRPITGAGKTIVIVDSFGSPTIQSDLQTFDAQFGFPNPDLQIEQFGAIPPFDPTNGTMVGWAIETTLDVEYAHSIAPGAKIVLAETPVAETEGVTGFPEMMNAEQSLINSGVGDVISQSFGATENTFPGFSSGNFSSLLDLRYAFKDAAAHGVTVLAASGDDGATNADLNGNLYPYRVNSWPSSDPLVTSVGGTQLNLDQAGNKLTPDVVWNDGFGAGGGGTSAVFSRPFYQIRVTKEVGKSRGTPDISMTAAVDGGAWVYWSFPGDGAPGWEIVGGTSEATPIMAGIVALANQQAGHRLGLINPALYALGALQHHGVPNTGIVSVTSGNNSFNGVTGFDAAPGYNLATGWGTIDAAKFVRALARVG
jgi:subtilase family serine protease